MVLIYYIQLEIYSAVVMQHLSNAPNEATINILYAYCVVKMNTSWSLSLFVHFNRNANKYNIFF